MLCGLLGRVVELVIGVAVKIVLVLLSDVEGGLIVVLDEVGHELADTLVAVIHRLADALELDALLGVVGVDVDEPARAEIPVCAVLLRDRVVDVDRADVDEPRLHTCGADTVAHRVDGDALVLTVGEVLDPCLCADDLADLGHALIDVEPGHCSPPVSHCVNVFVCV